MSVQGEMKAQEIAGSDSPGTGAEVAPGRKTSARRPPSIVINPSAQVLSRPASGVPVSQRPSAQQPPGPGRQKSRSVCHIHPSSCQCEKCPCPGLTGARVSGSSYNQRYMEPWASGLSIGPCGGGGARRTASRQTEGSASGWCGRLYLGRPPPFHRRPPPPLVLVRVPRSAGRYPTRGELLTGLTPSICWANAHRDLPLTPGCPRNMLRSLRAPPELFEEPGAAGAGPSLAPRWLDRVDSQTCTFPPAGGERGENLKCATCAQPKEQPAPDTGAKGKKRRRGDADADAQAEQQQQQGEVAEPAAGAEPDSSPSKAVLVGSKATLGRASRGALSLTVRLSGAPVSAKGSGSGAAAPATVSPRPSVRSTGSRGQGQGQPGAGPGAGGSTSRKPSGSLSLRQDSAMPLPGATSRSAVSVKPPLDGIRESTTSTPVAEPPPPPPEEQQQQASEVAPPEAAEEVDPGAEGEVVPGAEDAVQEDAAGGAPEEV
ncbi:putative ubiquitin carboxyl-terminal hydrolase creB [Frankliniella fusca]|uniref:Ubiquitin carboxyl-terminal hydrolase creB n=1 Tax=Frankliniella fusca TaxID=407009 RepID=A0AAE1HW75_9NEOP|nr:putative ubiquitin carboxyl-terminal hydrolase creB [Frankliniella fusca]